MILKDFIVYIEICSNRSKCRRKRLFLERELFRNILVLATVRLIPFKFMNFIPNGGYLSLISISNGLINILKMKKKDITNVRSKKRTKNVDNKKKLDT